VPEPTEPRWLLLIHHIPTKPSYLRVKISRRLQALGAVPVKNSVYVLPRSDHALEDFQWVRQAIVAGRGDASVCETRFAEGLSDLAVEALFNQAREKDYADLAREARRLQGVTGRNKSATRSSERMVIALGRLRKRLEEVVAIDFFGAKGRNTVEGLLAAVETSLKGPPPAGGGAPTRSLGEVRGRTWVTRAGVRIDRIASSWLIRRFIDPEARFKFVSVPDYKPAAGELRFDMFEAEFTHEGDRCTFEVLLNRSSIQDNALAQIGEIVHDIDLKDRKFQRAEAPGIDHLVAGITLRHEDDEARISEGASALESLYEYLRRQR